MFSTDDTIVAISTPPGRGGVGIVRISGPRATATAASLLTGRVVPEPRLATLTSVVDPVGRHRVDRVLATYFPAPHSYTGEDVVELSGHGSPVLLGQIVEAAQHAGARLAEPGEFTLRAFLHGRMDLVQAEAVGDLVDAVTPMQARAAFDQLEGTVTDQIATIERGVFDLVARLEASVDFPEEGYHFVEPGAVSTEAGDLADQAARLLADARRGRLLREGAQAVILGKPNVGKSTLFNALLGAPRAIVTTVAGTTRDLLTETLALDGIALTLVDTAGVRPTDDAIEAEGVDRALGALAVSSVVVLVLDRSCPLDEADRALVARTSGRPRVVVVNKTDLPPAWALEDLSALAAAPGRDSDGGEDTAATVSVSLVADGAEGLGVVRDAIARVMLAGESLRDPPSITNLRHIDLLERAHAGLRRATEAALSQAPEEFVLADLADVQQALGEVTGARTTDDVLERIFSEFCVGK